MHARDANGAAKDPAAKPRSSIRRGRMITTGVLLVATIVISANAVPQISASGDPVIVRTYDLDRSARGAVWDGTVDLNQYGFVILGQSLGTVKLPIRLGSVQRDRRVILRISAYSGPGYSTRMWISDRRGDREFAATGSGRTVDVTNQARRGALRLTAVARNDGAEPMLFLDQVQVIEAPRGARSDAEPWLVGLWLGLLSAFALSATGRLLHHWPVPAIAGVAGYVLWHPVADQAYSPLPPGASQLWVAARDAEWIDLEKGLVSGSFGELSPLAVQLYHVLSPLTGTGLAGARAASALVGVLVVLALYAAGHRVGNRLVGVVAAALALIADPFRDAAADGDATVVLLLSATVFLVAIHVCLGRMSWEELMLFGAAGALAVLADPTWWPGVLAAMAIITLAYAPRGARLRLFAVGLLVFVVLILPNRVSTAHQSDGDPGGDIARRATFVRNIEFTGRGHGAPASRADRERDPFGGERAGLAEYLLGDHSVPVAVGGSLSGLYDSLSAAARHDETKLAGALAFALCVLGFLYLLIVPRLRLLVLLPILLAVPQLFFASRDAVPAFEAGSAVWPAFVVAGAVLFYVIAQLLGRSSAAKALRNRRAQFAAGRFTARGRRRSRTT